MSSLRNLPLSLDSPTSYSSAQLKPYYAAGGDYWNNVLGVNTPSPTPTPTPKPTPTPTSQPIVNNSNNNNVSNNSNWSWSEALANEYQSRTGQPGASMPYGWTPPSGDNGIGATNDMYNQYYAQLDEILNNSLPGQSQNMITSAQANTNTNLAQNDLNLTQGQDLLNQQKGQANTTQNRNLKTLAESMRNQFNTGQLLLGSRGAGDSSAVNQYSYALTKMGNQQRGNIMSQTSDFVNQLAQKGQALLQTYQQEKVRINNELQSNMASIAQWLANAQDQIRMQKAQGGLQQGADIRAITTNLYNQALAAAQQTKTAFQNRALALENWAVNNSTSLDQLRQNIAGIQPLMGSPNVDNSGNIQWMPGNYYSNEKRNV